MQALCLRVLLIVAFCWSGAAISGCAEQKSLTRLGALPRAAALKDLPLCGSNIKPRNWAVSVGIDQYKDPGIPTLGGAAHDAWVMHHFFASPHGANVPIDRRMILLNHQATRANFEFALGRFLARACPQDTIYVYFAGHGAPEPDRPDDAFLFTHDTQLGNLVGTSLSMRQLPEFLKWRAGRVGKMVMLLDACHSGSINFPKKRGVTLSDNTQLSQPSYLSSLSASGSKGLGSAQSAKKSQEIARANAVFSQLKNLNKSQPQWSVLTAASSSQVAGELADNSQCPYTVAGYKGGLFTCSILEGIRGGADKDKNTKMKLSELHQFVEDRVSSQTRGSQTPQWLGSDIELPTLTQPLKIPQIPSELLRPPTRDTSALTWTGFWTTSAAAASTLVLSAMTYQHWNQMNTYYNDGRVTVSDSRYQESRENVTDHVSRLKWAGLVTSGLLLGTTTSYLVDKYSVPDTQERHWFTITPLQ